MQLKWLQKIQIAGAERIAQIVQQKGAFSGGLQIELVGVMIVLHFHIHFLWIADIFHTKSRIRGIFRTLHFPDFLLFLQPEKVELLSSAVSITEKNEESNI